MLWALSPFRYRVIWEFPIWNGTLTWTGNLDRFKSFGKARSRFTFRFRSELKIQHLVNSFTSLHTIHCVCVCVCVSVSSPSLSLSLSMCVFLRLSNFVNFSPFFFYSFSVVYSFQNQRFDFVNAAHPAHHSFSETLCQQRNLLPERAPFCRQSSFADLLLGCRYRDICER